ncbi:uncharacterized protein [Acropora muricata]|uniref:uncharacterized protein isoform X2 n=1 Tax=Acropora muricata TaxID=159855 RepID=UPI0034E4E374
MDFVAKIASSLDEACPRDLLHGLEPSCVSTLSQRLSRNSPYSLEDFRNLEDHGRLQALCCHFTMRNVLSFAPEQLSLADKQIIEMVDEMQRIGTSTEKTFLPSSPLSPFPAFETFIVNNKDYASISCYLSAWNAMAVDRFVANAKDDTHEVEPTSDPDE